MPDIQAVIFDFGGVLYFMPDRKSLQRWQKLLGLEKDELFTAMITSPDQSDYMRRVFTGEVTEAEVWEQAARQYRLAPWVFKWLQRNGLSRKRFNQPMADLLKGFRPQYKTAILSNAGDQGRKVFGEAYQLESLADLLIISAEEGLAKPDERIYRLACERLGVQPEQVVFVDDLIENVEATRKVGMTAIQFQSTGQVVAELGALVRLPAR